MLELVSIAKVKDDEGSDYSVTLKYPDGRQIIVRVPQADSWANDFINDGAVYGLSLVTAGHYC